MVFSLTMEGNYDSHSLISELVLLWFVVDGRLFLFMGGIRYTYIRVFYPILSGEYAENKGYEQVSGYHPEGGS